MPTWTWDGVSPISCMGYSHLDLEWSTTPSPIQTLEGFTPPPPSAGWGTPLQVWTDTQTHVKTLPSLVLRKWVVPFSVRRKRTWRDKHQRVLCALHFVSVLGQRLLTSREGFQFLRCCQKPWDFPTVAQTELPLCPLCTGKRQGVLITSRYSIEIDP